MNIHLYNPSSPSGEGRPFVKRACFIDYFPCMKEPYKGYSQRNMFGEKIKEEIRLAVESAGRLNACSVKLPKRLVNVTSLIIRKVKLVKIKQNYQ